MVSTAALGGASLGVGSFSFVAASAFCLAISSAFLCALACISFCLTGSFAMMPIRSLGTGVASLKVSANFLSSVSLTSLSALALTLRTFSALLLSRVAKFLNELRTSRSTVDVALGAPSLTLGEAVRPEAAAGRRGVAILSAGFASEALASTALLVSGFESRILGASRFGVAGLLARMGA